MMRLRPAFPIAIASLTFLAACTEWHAQSLTQGPRPAAIEGRVRVTRTDGRHLMVSAVEVRGDSLYAARVDAVSSPPVALSLAEVASVERLQGSSSGTALVVLGVSAAALRWVVFPVLLAPFFRLD